MNLGRLGRRLASWFAPPDLSGASYARIASASHRTRLAIGAAAVLTVPFVPGVSRHDRALLWALILLVYVPYSFVARLVASRSDGFVARAAQVMGDVLIVFLFAALVPATRI